MIVKNYICGILGLWLIISSFFQNTGFNSINNLFVGIILIVMCMYTTEGRTVFSWIISVIGLWLIIGAFISGVISGTGLYLNNIITGLLVAGIGVYQIFHQSKKAVYHPEDEDQDFSNFGAE